MGTLRNQVWHPVPPQLSPVWQAEQREISCAICFVSVWLTSGVWECDVISINTHMRSPSSPIWVTDYMLGQEKIKALEICFRKKHWRILSPSQLKGDRFRIPLTKMAGCSWSHCHSPGMIGVEVGPWRIFLDFFGVCLDQNHRVISSAPGQPQGSKKALPYLWLFQLDIFSVDFLFIKGN